MPILDHHLAVPELVVEQHVAQRGIGLLHRLRDDHTLAGRQPVVFQHCRQRTRGHVVARLLIRGEGTEPRRRDTVFGHQLLGELLRRLDARGRLRRAEDPQSRRTETVDDTRRQRRFGAYDRQRHVVRQRKIAQSLHLRLADRDALGLRRDARIARRAIDRVDPSAARQRIDNGMFAASATHYKNFHGSKYIFNSVSKSCGFTSRPPSRRTRFFSGGRAESCPNNGQRTRPPRSRHLSV